MRRLVYVTAALVAACQNDQKINRLMSPPVAAITWPEPLSVLRQGDGPLYFNGTAFDEYDSYSELQITWILDGEVTFDDALDVDSFTVLSLDAEDLPLGEHLIELEVFDSDGDFDRVGITWELKGPLSAPDVTILAPGDGEFFFSDSEITFEGSATDTGSDLALLDFTWSSSIDGVLTGDFSNGEGGTILFADGSSSPLLSDGSHTITLQAIDPDGEIGQDIIQISIGDLLTPAEPGDLVFSEMMINPQVVADDVGEWVELYNTASYPIDVEGYTFRDNDFDEYALEGSLIVAGKDYIVLCADTNTSRNGGVPCDGAFKRKSADALALGNGSDEVILARPDGIIIDEVYYDSDWFTPAIAIGLDPDRLDADFNNSASNWCSQTTVTTSGGEPGRDNDPC
jgi:hypothetical protein